MDIDMLQHLVKWLIGGQSGSREFATLAWFLWLALTVYLLSQGNEVTISSMTYTVWITVTPLAWGWMGVAFFGKKVLDKFRPEED
jgi:hypothetical protein